ncbi:hypothetical protein NDU88_008007, partial [Pleurodeles waltl]
RRAKKRRRTRGEEDRRGAKSTGEAPTLQGKTLPLCEGETLPLRGGKTPPLSGDKMLKQRRQAMATTKAEGRVRDHTTKEPLAKGTRFRHDPRGV